MTRSAADSPNLTLSRPLAFPRPARRSAQPQLPQPWPDPWACAQPTSNRAPSARTARFARSPGVLVDATVAGELPNARDIQHRLAPPEFVIQVLAVDLPLR